MMHREKLRACCMSFVSIESTDVVCRQSNIELSIGQPMGHATNHWGALLSHNVAVITSYTRGFNEIHFISQSSFRKRINTY